MVCWFKNSNGIRFDEMFRLTTRLNCLPYCPNIYHNPINKFRYSTLNGDQCHKSVAEVIILFYFEILFLTT